MINTDTIQVTQELLALLSELDEFKGAWRAFSTIAPERLNALRHVATVESIGSSTRIEGSKLTDREVERLLGSLEIRRFGTRDEQEVAGYADVMETVFRSWSDIPLTENHIKQLHRDLLQYSEKDERHRGNYKTLRNDVGAFDADGKMIGIVFETATPFDTPRRMAELASWLDKTREIRHLHPLLTVAVFVVVFLGICARRPCLGCCPIRPTSCAVISPSTRSTRTSHFNCLPHTPAGQPSGTAGEREIWHRRTCVHRLNTNPFFDEPNLIILDDAHSAEPR
jgi:hypothetical protein